MNECFLPEARKSSQLDSINEYRYSKDQNNTSPSQLMNYINNDSPRIKNQLPEISRR